MTPMTASAVIPAYNQERYIGEAIESVLAQTIDVELVVVDDGSTDRTAEVARSYGVRVLQQDNKGVSAARNAGARATSGDVIAFLDSDDVWLPQKLERQLALLSEDASAGLAHCAVQDIGPDGDPLSAHSNGLSGWVADELLLLERPVILGGGSGLAVRRSVYEQVGGFVHELSTSADWYFFFCVAKDHPVVFDEQPGVLYRRHGGNMSSNVARMERDMLAAFSAAFAAPGFQHLRRQSYGNLHRVLAGSYMNVGDRRKAVEHGVRSALLTPRNTLNMAGYPLRRLRRSRGPSPRQGLASHHPAAEARGGSGVHGAAGTGKETSR